MITDAILKGQKVILVPYQTEHVQVKPPNRYCTILVYPFILFQQYHQWMSDPVLRQLTASEPLTLDEEYDMQSELITPYQIESKPLE